MRNQVFNFFLAQQMWRQAEATAERRKNMECSSVDRLIADALLVNVCRRAAELLNTTY